MVLKYIHRYDGPNIQHKPNNKTVSYGTDIQKENSTSDWKYSFNVYGYRGPDCQLETGKTIFAIGSGNTFGVGLRWEDTWPYHFANKYLNSFTSSDDLSLINLSQYNASNDYISRTVIRQCDQLKPDLLLVDFTHCCYKEYLIDNKFVNINPWTENELNEFYYYYYSEEDGFVSTIKNIILVQNYCKLNNIEYLLSWEQINEFEKVTTNTNPIVKLLSKTIDTNYMCNFTYLNKDINCDLSRDKRHIGPLTSMKFADKLFADYVKKYNKILSKE